MSGASEGRSYDSMVAHTAIMFIRYIMLSLDSRCGQDPRTIGNLFYVCCDELQDISLVEALQKIFLPDGAVLAGAPAADEGGDPPVDRLPDQQFALIFQGTAGCLLLRKLSI